MLHHSFDKTLSYDDTLGDWVSSASTMALRDRVQLLPPVPNRYGVLWNMQALSTRDFEVRFTFSGIPSDQEPRDALLAFWLSPESFAAGFNEQDIVTTKSKDWLEGLKATGMTFLHNKPNFAGLALLFAGLDRQKAPRQSVTAVWNDGQRTLDVESLPDVQGAQTKFVDWLSEGTQVKVRVMEDGSISGSMMTLDVRAHLADTIWSWNQDGTNSAAYLAFLKDGRVRLNDGTPNGRWKVLAGHRLHLEVPDYLSVTMRFNGALSASQEEPKVVIKPKMIFVGPLNPSGQEEEFQEEHHWVDLFKLPPGTLTAKESFLGFSGWSGSASSVEANLHQLEVLNFDASAIGEDEADVLGRDLSEWLQVLEQEKRFVDQASQTEAVVRLTKLLTDHFEQYDQIGEKLRADILNMEARVDTLSANISVYLTQAQAWDQTQKIDPKIVKEHIVGIRAVLSKDRAMHDAKLTAVHDAAVALKAQHSSKLDEGGRAKIQVVSDQSKTVEVLAERGSMQTNSLLLVMVVAVAALGLLFLNRMRYYEKKHYI